jgi:hypothetical protein
MYRIDLQELLDDLKYKPCDTYTASKTFREICRRHESTFLKIGFFAKDKEAKSKTA